MVKIVRPGCRAETIANSLRDRRCLLTREYDLETGLYYYGARYYNPAMGRFISPDSFVQNLRDPQALNRYSYVGNNPLIYIDPTGHFKLKKLVKPFVVGVVGGAVFVLSGGTATPFVAAMYAGMAAGATGAALNGGSAHEILRGAVIGGALGAAGGGLYSTYGAVASYGMMATGAGYSYHRGEWEGLAYFASGVAGGLAGGYGATYVKDNWNNWFGASGKQNLVVAVVKPWDPQGGCPAGVACVDSGNVGAPEGGPNPGCYLCAYYLSQVYCEVRDYGNCASYLELTTRLNATASEPYEMLGDVYSRVKHGLKNGGLNNAIENYKKAVQLDPYNVTFRLKLAKAYAGN